MSERDQPSHDKSRDAPTPRTDALAAAQLVELDRPMRVADHKIELWNLCRDLERALADEHRRAEAFKEAMHSFEQAAKFERDRADKAIYCTPSSAGTSIKAWSTCPDCGSGNRLNGELIHAPECSRPEEPQTGEPALAGIEDALWRLHSYESNRDDAGRVYSEKDITEMVAAVRVASSASTSITQRCRRCGADWNSGQVDDRLRQAVDIALATIGHLDPDHPDEYVRGQEAKLRALVDVPDRNTTNP